MFIFSSTTMEKTHPSEQWNTGKAMIVVAVALHRPPPPLPRCPPPWLTYRSGLRHVPFLSPIGTTVHYCSENRETYYVRPISLPIERHIYLARAYSGGVPRASFGRINIHRALVAPHIALYHLAWQPKLVSPYCHPICPVFLRPPATTT